MTAALRLLRPSLVPSLLAAAAAGTVGCTVLGYPTGSIYTGTKVPHGAMRIEGSGAGKGGTARGEACATGILGLVAFGDASLAAAKKAGGIAEVHSVEFGGMSILGIYTKGCTIAYGPEGAAGGGGGGGGGAAGGGGGGGGAGGGGSGQGNPSPTKPSEPGASGPGAPMSGGPMAGSGGPPKGLAMGGGPTTGGNGGPPPKGVGATLTLVGFSYLSDEPVSRESDHQCMTYDPSQPSDPNPLPSVKEDFASRSYHGHFVDHCPTENVIATCDQRRTSQRMTYYYKGKTTGDLDVTRRVACPMFKGVWTWVAPAPPPPPKPPASSGPIAFACDSPKAFQCKTFRPDMDPKKIAEQKGVCPIMQGTAVDHCPSAGLKGRCEDPATGITTYHYLAAMTDLAWPACEKSGGKWTAP